jgi:hypothetical protein
MADGQLPDALLMTILTETFLPLVSGHFMALTLLSAWHWNYFAMRFPVSSIS